MRLSNMLQGPSLRSCLGVVFTLVGLVSCAPPPLVEPDRSSIPDLSGKFDQDLLSAGDQLLHAGIFPQSRYQSACFWLDNLRLSESSYKQGFRPLESFEIKKFEVDDLKKFKLAGEVFDGKLFIEKIGLLPPVEDEDLESRCRRLLRNRGGGGGRSGIPRSPTRNQIKKCMEEEAAKREEKKVFQHSESLVSRAKSEKDLIELANLYGQISLNDNPLYEYGLMGQSGSESVGGQIPNKEEFFVLFEEEKKRSKFLKRVAMTLLRPMFENKDHKWSGARNDILAETLAESLPGAYGESAQLRKLEGTFPDIAVRNGFPHSEFLKPLPLDSASTLNRKELLLKESLEKMTMRTAMFRDETWTSYLDDMQHGVSVAVRGMQSPSPKEQACASVILQRAFSQMLTVKGYDRAPLINVTHNGRKRKTLPHVSEFLASPTASVFKSCRQAGSFLRDGKLTQVKDHEFVGSSGGSGLLLTNKPNGADPCQPKWAYPLRNHKEQWTVSLNPKDFRAANFHEQLEFLGGTVYFLMAMAPGAPWWFNERSLMSYPLADFGDNAEHKDMLASGGLLPYEAFAISLGYVNLLGMPLLEEHLLYVDEFNREVDGSSDEVMGVRFSRVPIDQMEQDNVVTELDSVLLIADVVFKLDETLKTMDEWFDKALVDMKERERIGGVAGKAAELEHDAFLMGMFGAGSRSDALETLELLTDDSKGSLRDQMEQLKVAITMLLPRFARPISIDGETRYSCGTELHTDLKTGFEVLKGDCKNTSSNRIQSLHTRWKQVLTLVGRTYQSPLFLDMAR